MADGNEKKRLIYNIVSAVILIGIFAFCTFAIGPKLIDMVKAPDRFREYVSDHLFTGSLIFVAIQMFQVFFALIPGEPIEIAAGAIFGWWYGLLLCMAGGFAATVCIFLLTRKFGRKFTYIVFAEDKLRGLRFMQNEKRVELVFALLFFIPGTPKDILTYIGGLTNVNAKRFLLIATFFKIPSIVTSTIAGEKLMERDFITSVAVFAGTAVVSLIGLIIYRAFTKHKQATADTDSEDTGQNQVK